MAFSSSAFTSCRAKISASSSLKTSSTVLVVLLYESPSPLIHPEKLTLDLNGAFPLRNLLIEEEEEPSLPSSAKLNCLLRSNEISLSGKLIETLNFDFANFCCLERSSDFVFMELRCNGDCLRILLGRSLADLVRKLTFLTLKTSPFSSSKLAVLGTAGAMENRAALNVAIRTGGFGSHNWAFGWTAAEAEPETLVGSASARLWGLEVDFPNLRMTTLGFDRRRIFHRRREQRRRRFRLRSLSIDKAWAPSSSKTTIRELERICREQSEEALVWSWVLWRRKEPLGDTWQSMSVWLWRFEGFYFIVTDGEREEMLVLTAPRRIMDFWGVLLDRREMSFGC